jgi:sigma-B regulation protein RsbU (phosphoserine phosphatase)
VGLLPQASYESARLELQPGDLLTLFTDGMSETMNSADEEWGEEQLIEALTRSNHSCPEAIITNVFEAADAFAAGAPQHDDMTLVVCRITD